MKKEFRKFIIGLALGCILTSATILIANSSELKTTQELNDTHIECSVCQKGTYLETYQNLFVWSPEGIFPVFNAKHLMCSHCRTIFPDFELKK